MTNAREALYKVIATPDEVRPDLWFIYERGNLRDPCGYVPTEDLIFDPPTAPDSATLERIADELRMIKAALAAVVGVLGAASDVDVSPTIDVMKADDQKRYPGSQSD